MLYGTLLQAMPFLKNDERIPMWQAQYDKIIQVLKTEDITRIGDRQAIVLDS
jgi:Mg2+/Co2+ transporter CorB